MAFTAGFSVNVGDPTKASDVDVLAANDDYLKNAIDTFIANDANNRVLTATGSGTANAESNLTFDGSTLTVTGTVSATTFNGNVTGNLSGNVTGGTISGTTGTFSGDLAVDTDTLYVDASADSVGIGTSSPSLQAWRTNTYLTINNGTDGGVVELVTSASDASGNEAGAILWGATGNTTNHKHLGGIEMVTDGSTATQRGAYMRLLTKADGTAQPTERARIDSSGNVGIGTFSPVALSNQTSLTVNGTSVGRVDVKAGGGGGGVIYGTGSEFAWAANSGMASNFYGAASQPIIYTIGSNEVARFTQSNGSGGLTLKTNAGNDLISMTPEGSGGYEEKLLLKGYNNGTASFVIGHSVPNYINTGQNFGIGTSSPTVPLHLVTTNTGAASIFDAQGNNNVCYARYINDQDSYLEVSHYGSARADTFAGISLANYSLIKTAGTHNGLIIGTSGSDPMVFATNNTERLRLTSAGNFGIGTTSPRLELSVKGNNSTSVGIAVDNDSGSSTLDIAALGATYTAHGAAPGEVWFYSPDNINIGGATGNTNDIKFLGNGSERARLTSAGNFGIGSQSPTYKLVVSNGGAAGYEFNVNGLNSGVNTLTYNRSTSAYVDSAHFVDNYYIYSGQTPAERFRVESTGVCAFMTPNINIRFNGTATQSVLTNNDGVEIYTGGYIWAGRQAASLYLNRAGTTGDVAVFYYNSTTSVGSISVTSSATAYNTSSDYRLKENLVPITGAVDRVNALQPRRFNFISDPDTTVDGFVAHEVSSVVPEAITGEKDAVDEEGNPEYQGIDQSKLVPLLTAAIQELTLTTQELTARIEALEAA